MSPTPTPEITESSPCERRTIEVDGASLEVTIAGPLDDGPVVCAAHPADRFDEGTALLLRQACGAAVVCVNGRGLGTSSPAAAPAELSFEVAVDDVDAVRRSLGLARWTFWGMSGGGWLGQLYARRHPTALAGLVLESTCGCFRRRVADPTCVLSPRNPAWRGALAEAGLFAEDAHDQPVPAAELACTELAGVGSVLRRRGGPALLVSPAPLSPEMRARMAIFWTFDARPWLGAIASPTLVICGDADPIVPLAHARALAEAIPQADLAVIAGAGHVPVAAGRPEVGAAVRRFMGALPGAR